MHRVLLAVPDGPVSPAPRVRVLQYIPALQARGCECEVMVMRGPRATARSLATETDPLPLRVFHLLATVWSAQRFQLRLLFRAGRYDRILLHRIPISAWARPFLASHRQRLVVDFDDALYDSETANLGVIGRVRRRALRRSLERSVRVAAVVITSNAQNARWVGAMGGDACIIPTSVDAERIHPGLRRSRRPLVIGWMGTPSTSRYLSLIESPLRDVLRRNEAVLRLVGISQNPFRGLDADVRPWTLESEPEELMGFDVGIMPMPDTPWTRGKAAFKALQYGAASVPAVASWTETNEEILGRDAGALLCRSAEEWVRALDRLLHDEALRAELGERGRQRVLERYSVAVNAPRLAEVLVSGRRGDRP